MWGNFLEVNLPEPDDTSEEDLLEETAKQVDIIINSDDLTVLAKRNDGTFRNIVENISYARTEGFTLSSDNFRDTLRGTWQKRYQKAVQKDPVAKHIYDSIELSQIIGINLKFSTVIQLAQIISGENILERIKHRRLYSSTLRQLIKTESILSPRDGQIEAKGYQINPEKYLPLVFRQLFFDSVWSRSNIIRRIYYLTLLLSTPNSVFDPTKNFSYMEKILHALNHIDFVLYKVGQRYANAGFDSYAEHLLKKSIEIGSTGFLNKTLFRRNTSFAWHMLGYLHFKHKDYDAAIIACQKAIELNPKYSTPWLNLGLIYRVMEQYEDAIKAYKRCVELDPEEARAWNELGTAYNETEQADSAINAYRKAIEINPKYIRPWLNLSLVYRSLEKFDDAISACQSAIEINQNYARAWYDLGITYNIQKSFESSLQAYQKAVELEPEIAWMRISLGGILKKIGDMENAKKELERARPLLEKGNEYDRACFNSIYGNTDEALQLLKIAIEEKQTNRQRIKLDPDFDFIRDEPRFRKLVGSE